MTTEKCSAIAIDAMGGDNAPDEIIKGLASFEHSGFCFLLFGNAERLSELTKKYLSSSFPCEIIDSHDVVTSDMSVGPALRLSKTSSMGMAINAVKNGVAKAVVSSGNTGAYMALAKMILKTINGIDRPAIAGVIPGINGKSIMLDLGANAECSLRNIFEFAIMGEALARAVLQKSTPSIALLNIGSENTKGSQLVKSAAEAIRGKFEKYIGFIEGTEIVSGNVDVIVTDGFSGNIALKSIEGTAKSLFSEIKSTLKSSLLSKLASILMVKRLKSLATKYDPRVHNGAILIGLNGLVVKSHGNSDALGTESAIKFAINALSENILDRISSQVENCSDSHTM